MQYVGYLVQGCEVSLRGGWAVRDPLEGEESRVAAQVRNDVLYQLI